MTFTDKSKDAWSSVLNLNIGDALFPLAWAAIFRLEIETKRDENGFEISGLAFSNIKIFFECQNVKYTTVEENRKTLYVYK